MITLNLIIISPMLSKILFLSLIFCITFSKNGLDFAQPHTDSDFNCFSRQTATFAIVQAYLMTGNVNTNVVQNLITGKNRGFAMDIFMHHCTSKEPSFQVNEMMNAVPQNLYDTVWVRVQQNPNPGCDWTNTPQKNCQYLKSLVSTIQSRGKKVGIFSNYAIWKIVFQTLTYCPDVSNLPLWYSADDKSPSFSSFTSFGGWRTPTMKTFNYRCQVCGTVINLDWKP